MIHSDPDSDSSQKPTFILLPLSDTDDKYQLNRMKTEIPVNESPRISLCLSKSICVGEVTAQVSKRRNLGEF